MGKLILPLYGIGFLMLLSGAGNMELDGFSAAALCAMINGLALMVIGAVLSERKRKRERLLKSLKTGSDSCGRPQRMEGGA